MGEIPRGFGVLGGSGSAAPPSSEPLLPPRTPRAPSPETSPFPPLDLTFVTERILSVGVPGGGEGGPGGHLRHLAKLLGARHGPNYTVRATGGGLEGMGGLLGALGGNWGDRGGLRGEPWGGGTRREGAGGGRGLGFGGFQGGLGGPRAVLGSPRWSGLLSTPPCPPRSSTCPRSAVTSHA